MVYTMKQYGALDDTFYFWFAANNTSGSGDDGASPAADVRLAGAAVDAAPVYSPTPTLLSHVDYPAGAYEITITASVANGFAADNTYAVFSTLAVDSQNPTGFVGSFDTKAVESDAPTAVENAIAVWDRILTGATHNIATSAGRRIREIGAYAIDGGTAQGGNGFSITLAATASGDDGVYNRNLIVLVDNTGAGQTRTIVDYNATTKLCVVDREWRVSPDATTEYQVVPDDTPLTVDHGRARGGTLTTIILREYASSVDDTYLCNQIGIIAGPGRGQNRLVGAYDGTTKIVTICGDPWVTTPTTDSIYVMMPYGTTCTSCLGDYALDLITTDIDTNSTQLAAIKAKTDHISEGIAKGVALNAFTFTMFDLNGNPATGLTVALYISQDGGSFTLATNSVSEISMGAYKIDLIDAEMNANVIALGATATSAAQTSITIVTV